MKHDRRKFLAIAGWAGGVTGLHLWLNVDWEGYMNARLPRSKRKLLVGYVPVT